MQNDFLWNHSKIISWIRGFVINCGLCLKKLEAQFIWEWISANSLRGQKLQNDFSWNRFKISILWIRDEPRPPFEKTGGPNVPIFGFWSSANSIWGQKLQNDFSWNHGKISISWIWGFMMNRGLRLKRLDTRFSWEWSSANSIWGQKFQNYFSWNLGKIIIFLEFVDSWRTAASVWKDWRPDFLESALRQILFEAKSCKIIFRETTAKLTISEGDVKLQA